MQCLRNTIEGPVDLQGRNHQRRSDADHALVCLFAENAELLQALAIRTRRNVQFNADPETFAPNLVDARSADRSEPIKEVRAEVGGFVAEILFN